MKLLIMLAIIMSGNVFAESNECRELIVKAQKSLGNEIETDSFSTTRFEDLNISISEFNAMDSEVQSDIYMQVKPLSVMVEETISDLNKTIQYYAESFYAFFMIDELEEMRSVRDSLRKCSNN